MAKLYFMAIKTCILTTNLLVNCKDIQGGTRDVPEAVFGKTFAKQECIPVGCVPSAHWPYPVVSATQAPCHAHPRCHACPLKPTHPCHAHPPPRMPPAMYAPCHTCPPIPCMPPTMHAPYHACPPAMHTPLWTEFLTHASEKITLPQLHCGR